jgi:hypothetical protein
VKDAAGNSATFTSTTTSKLDTATPDIVAVDSGASDSDRISLTSDTWFAYAATGSDDTISFTWTDAASTSDDTYYYELNSTATDTIDGTETSTTNNYIDSISIAEGTNYFHVKPMNGAGTYGVERVFIVKYDKTNPTTSAAITSGTLGNNAWYITDAEATITPADAISGADTTLYCVDTSDTCSPSLTYTAPITFSTEIINYLRYATTDNAGNIQPTESLTVKVDKSIPTGGSTSSTDGYLASTTIPVAVDRGSDATSGMSATDSDYTLEYTSATLSGGSCGSYGSWTDAGVTETATGTSYNFIATDGNCYTFRYTVKDAAGNVVTYTSTTTTKVDSLTPDIVAIDSGASDSDRISLTSDTWFAYAATGSDDAVSFSWTDAASTSDDTYYYELNSTATDTIDGTEASTTNPYIDSITIAEGTNYFHVKPRNGAGTYGTERIFIVKYDKSNPTIEADTLTSPNGGEIWSGNRSYDITWDSTDITDAVAGFATSPIALHYTTNGVDWNLIDAAEANDGTYSWLTPDITSSTVKIRITATDLAGNTITEVSDVDFALSASTNFVALHIISGNNQTGGMNGTLTDEFKVRVGNGADSQEIFAGADAVTVTFTIAATPLLPAATGQALTNGIFGTTFGGTSSAKTVTTDADGYASASFTLGDRAGEYTVTSNFTGCQTLEANRTFTSTERKYFRFTLSDPNINLEIDPSSSTAVSASTILTITSNAASYQINLVPTEWPTDSNVNTTISNWTGTKGFGWDNNNSGTSGGVDTPTAFSGLDTPTDAYICSGDTCQGVVQFTLDFHTAINYDSPAGTYRNTVGVESGSVNF